MKILKEGYEIPFKCSPEPYYERNNKTARDNMQVVRQIVADMVTKGIVKIVKERPRVVSPLGLVSKVQEDGSIKHRLVFDASRHVNLYINLPHVRLNHLDKALEITRENDFQIVYDLASAYYHIKIKEEQQEFLGAAFLNSDGSEVYFKYCHLPFGLSSAVHIITKIWKPITQYLNKIGIRNTIYIDDGRILAVSKEEAEDLAIRTYNIITKAGWAIEKEKSDKPNASSKLKKYLGFLIDTEKMKICAPEMKIKAVKEQIVDLIARHDVPVKHLAAVLGRIISLEYSHGMLVRVTTRSGYTAIANHTDHHGWKGSVVVSENIRKEFKFLAENIIEKNGTIIKSSTLEVSLESIVPGPQAKRSQVRNHIKGDKIFVSDSSELKTFVYNLSAGGTTELIGSFTEEERSWSSGARELLALSWTLKQWSMTGMHNNTSVYWLTDSENVVTFLEKGSRKPAIQNLLFELVELCFKLGIHIMPIHLFRSDPRITLADEGSRRLDSDNWSIDHHSFESLRQMRPLEVDMFSDGNNARLPKFCSLYYAPGTLAVDAFTIIWETLGCLWLCPPVSQLIRICHRIRKSKCHGILVLPVWKTSNFYNLFFDDSGLPKEPFTLIKLWHPYIIQNENARHTALFGSVPFEFAALEFNTMSVWKQ